MNLDDFIQRLGPNLTSQLNRAKWGITVVGIDEPDHTFLFLNYKDAVAGFEEARGAIGERWSDVVLFKVIKHIS